MIKKSLFVQQIPMTSLIVPSSLIWWMCLLLRLASRHNGEMWIFLSVHAHYALTSRNCGKDNSRCQAMAFQNAEGATLTPPMLARSILAGLWWEGEMITPAMLQSILIGGYLNSHSPPVEWGDSWKTINAYTKRGTQNSKCGFIYTG